MRGIIQYLNREGYSVPDAGFYSYIRLWLKWYRGKTSFHSYAVYNGAKRITKSRKTLGMAKRVPEDWANLLLNEKVEIVIDGEAQQKAIDEVLHANNFRVRGNQLVELAFALGTGAFVELLDDNGEVDIDYIRASMIFPLTYKNGEITECAFASERKIGQETFVYLNIHTKKENGNYVVRNVYFKKQGDNITETQLPENVADEIDTKSPAPLFQIVKPNIVNNIDLDNPMGISVFANGIDQLEGVDLAYDSYCNEYKLGKKRIIIPVKMARVQMDEDGTTKPIFDYDDTEFYAITGADESMGIKEINMDIRATEHETGIKTMLNMLSKACGLGDDYYDYQSSGVKTAKEVVSEKSDLFQNLKKHELVLEHAVRGMVMAIASLKNISIDPENVKVNFDDSIIEDTGAEKERFLQEIRDGVRQKWEYRVKFFGETEEEAKTKVQADTQTWFEE